MPGSAFSREGRLLSEEAFRTKFRVERGRYSGTSYGNRIHFYDHPTIHRLVPLVSWRGVVVEIMVTIVYIYISPLSVSLSLSLPRANPYFDPANIAGSKHSYIFRGENYARLDPLVGDRGVACQQRVVTGVLLVDDV